MSEDVARAVGAKGRLVTIGGKEVQIRGLGVRELTEVQREAVQQYKKEMLADYKLGAEYMPDPTEYMEKKVEEVRKIQLGDLPAKYVYDPERLELSPKLREFVYVQLGLTPEQISSKDLGPELADLFGNTELDDKRILGWVSSFLDCGTLTPQEYENLVGKPPQRFRIGYVNWWITGDFEGMLTLLWMSVKDQGITRKELSDQFSHEKNLLLELSREVESLSQPSEGNG